MEAVNVSSSPGEGPGREWPSGLVAVLLLAGGSRRPELAATGRTPLSLPLAGGETVLGLLLNGLGGAGGDRKDGGAGDAGAGLEVRLLAGTSGLDWPTWLAWRWSWLTVESDPRRLRGTGGVLMDATAGYDAESWVLAVQAAQVRTEPLREVADRLMASAEAERADVAVSVDGDDRPDGVMLLRCRALRQLKPVGFVDFKEQALAEVARTHRVVASRGRGRSVGVRTLREYLDALALSASAGQRDPVGELDPASPSRFRLIEDGAAVDEGAVLVDSVVLRGGSVEAGAVVRRSVIGAGARVRRTSVVVERLVGGEGSGG